MASNVFNGTNLLLKVSADGGASKRYATDAKGNQAELMKLLIKATLDCQQRARALEGSLQDVWTASSSPARMHPWAPQCTFLALSWPQSFLTCPSCCGAASSLSNWRGPSQSTKLKVNLFSV